MTTGSEHADDATTTMPTEPSKRRRWPWITVAVLVVAAFGALGYLVYDLQGQVDDLSSQIGRVSNRASSLESDVSSLESDVSSLESDVSSLEYDVSTLESDLNVHEGGSRAVFGQISQDIGDVRDCVNAFIDAWASNSRAYYC